VLFSWARDDEFECLMMHQTVMFPKKSLDEVSDECMDLLKKMLEKEQGMRSMAGSGLEHPSFAAGQSEPETNVLL
jgi:hypothetical protein